MEVVRGLMATRTVSLVDSVNLPANAWRFSAPINVPERAQRVTIQATDPASQWFTTPGGFVKTWGLQLQGYNGGPWDDVSPWAGWGWWLFEPGGDPRTVLLQPELWIPYGRPRLRGAGPGLLLGWSRVADPLEPDSVVRLAIQVDTPITLGAEAILGS